MALKRKHKCVQYPVVIGFDNLNFVVIDTKYFTGQPTKTEKRLKNRKS